MPPPLLVLRYVVTQSLMPSPFSPHPTLTHSGRVRKGEDNVGLTPPCHDFAGHSVAHRTHDRCPAAPPLFYWHPPPTHTHRAQAYGQCVGRTLPATALNPPPPLSLPTPPLSSHTQRKREDDVELYPPCHEFAGRILAALKHVTVITSTGLGKTVDMELGHNVMKTAVNYRYMWEGVGPTVAFLVILVSFLSLRLLAASKQCVAQCSSSC